MTSSAKSLFSFACRDVAFELDVHEETNGRRQYIIRGNDTEDNNGSVADIFSAIEKLSHEKHLSYQLAGPDEGVAFFAPTPQVSFIGSVSEPNTKNFLSFLDVVSGAVLPRLLSVPSKKGFAINVIRQIAQLDESIDFRCRAAWNYALQASEQILDTGSNEEEIEEKASELFKSMLKHVGKQDADLAITIQQYHKTLVPKIYQTASTPNP